MILLFVSNYKKSSLGQFNFSSLGFEDASKIMPSSGAGSLKEHKIEKREDKSNQKTSHRSSKVMDLNKVEISYYSKFPIY